MSPIVLVVVDHQDGVLRPSAAELVTLARGLGEPVAVQLGGVPAEPDRLGDLGVRTLHHVPVDPAGPALAAASEAVLGVARSTGASTVLMSSTFENKELAAVVAHALDAALAVDVLAVEAEGAASATERAASDGHLITTQQAFAATWTLRSETRVERAVVTVKPNSVHPEPAPVGGPAEVVVHEAPVADVQGVRVVERTERPVSGRPALTEATVVVAGGRGTEGDFTPVEELADALGGAVGATRVATDEGWIGHEAQIGQTGVTVSPRLYIGAGISGAVHHRGGMQSSGTIVAVNDDPESPIFEIADFGVVGDLFQVLPQAAAEIRRIKDADTPV